MHVGRIGGWLRAALITLLFTADLAATTTELTVVPSSSVAASRIEAIDLDRLGASLARAGLTVPPRVVVTLIPDSDARARGVPEWVVGLALDPSDIVIFPDRVLSYPYDSLESVFRHEIAHLALSARAGGQPMPRWFHEGLAVSVDAGWGVAGQMRLLLEMAGDPATADLAKLFAANTETMSARAYGLSAALVADVQRRHGSGAPGAIAARVAAGVPFDQAFALETGETPDDAARRAWAGYRRWTMWVSVATSGSAIWGLILAIALGAFIARARKRAQQRRRWDDEERVDIPSD